MKRLRIPITVQDHDLDGHFSQLIGAPRQSWPVRFGVPFPRGALRDANSLLLLDGKRPVPFHGQITNRWPDGSVRWISMLALVDLRVSETKFLRLNVGGASVPRPGRGTRESKADRGTEAPPTITSASDTAGGFILSSSGMTVKASSTLDPFEIRRGGSVLASTPPSFELELEDGQMHRPKWESAELQREGDLRSRVVYRGRYVNAAGVASFDVEFGIEFTAAQPWIESYHRMTHCLAGKPRLTVGRFAVRQPWKLDDPQYVVRQTHRGEQWLPRDVRKQGRVEVRVAANRAYVSDVSMVDERVESYPPYLQKGLDSVEPWLAICDAQQTVLFWTPESLGHSPQGWTLDGSEATIEFIPDPVEFTQGRAKTHRWRWHFADISPHANNESDPRHYFDSTCNHLALLHALQPIVSVDPRWTRSCKIARLDRSLTCDPSRHPRFEGIVNHLFDLKWPHGMMNWGDDIDPGYTQNYALTGLKKEGAVWTNNEYDFIYATIHQMLRTGQGRFWRVVERSVQHALDVDFVHYSDDPWLHHGSPAHSVNHTSAASYPSHIWTEGLLHYYYLSADARALEIAKKSGDFILRYQEKRWWVFEETARESGWALLALTELYAATGERKFLDGARRIKEFVVNGTEQRHPLFPGEASFFIGVLVMGLDKLHDRDSDAQIPRTIDRIMQWRLDHRMSPEGIPLYHWDASARMINSREIIFPAALAIAHRHTRKKQYLEAMWRCLQYWLDTNTFYGSPLCTKTAAAYYRTWIEALHELAEKKLLSRLEFQPAGKSMKVK